MFISRLTVPCWLLLPVWVSSRPVSPRTDRPVSTLFLPTPLVWSSLLLESTRWTPLSPLTARSVMKRSPRKSAPTSRRLATTQLLWPLCPSPVGMETTCWSPAPMWVQRYLHVIVHLTYLDKEYKHRVLFGLLDYDQNKQTKTKKSQLFWSLKSVSYIPIHFGTCHLLCFKEETLLKAWFSLKLVIPSKQIPKNIYILQHKKI